MASTPLYPFDFVVPGTPRSLQTKSRTNLQLWKEEVREVARTRRDDVYEEGFLDEVPVAATIFYFSAAPLEGDIDNIVKPILDAIISIAYLDDRFVERVVVQKFEPGVERAIDVTSEQLAVALDTPPPVIYVRVEADCAWRNVR